MIKLMLLSSLILFNTSQAMLFTFIDSPRPLAGKIAMIQSLVPLEVQNYINLPNDQGDTPLLHLCKKAFQNKEEQTQLAQLLIEKGADINSQTNDGNTPLHLAIIKSNRSLVKLINDKRPILKSNRSNLDAFELARLLGKFDMQEIMAPGTGDWDTTKESI